MIAALRFALLGYSAAATGPMVALMVVIFVMPPMLLRPGSTGPDRARARLPWPHVSLAYGPDAALLSTAR